jgi:hypothetical protein
MRDEVSGCGCERRRRRRRERRKRGHLDGRDEGY